MSTYFQGIIGLPWSLVRNDRRHELNRGIGKRTNPNAPGESSAAQAWRFQQHRLTDGTHLVTPRNHSARGSCKNSSPLGKSPDPEASQAEGLSLTSHSEDLKCCLPAVRSPGQTVAGTPRLEGVPCVEPTAFRPSVCEASQPAQTKGEIPRGRFSGGIFSWSRRLQQLKVCACFRTARLKRRGALNLRHVAKR